MWYNIKENMTFQVSKNSKELSQEKEKLTKPEIGPIPEITPETKPLTQVEKEGLKKEVLEEIAAEKLIEKKPIPTFVSQITPLAGVKSKALLEIEGILEQDLQEVYFKMEPAAQKKFRMVGEQTAKEIEKILQKTKVRTKRIFELIIEWLKLIPGVNKFFIRQEAKIKTEKILKLKK